MSFCISYININIHVKPSHITDTRCIGVPKERKKALWCILLLFPTYYALFFLNVLVFLDEMACCQKALLNALLCAALSVL